jgi:N-acetylglutamate synthase-like GNAT family acetyltransferase
MSKDSNAGKLEAESPQTAIRIHRAALDELPAVQQIVDEYCDAIGVLVRDKRSQLEDDFNEDSGIWLASDANNTIGCVVLRALPSRPEACEVKRLYVRRLYRGKQVADALMDALEAYAVRRGYRTAYLDTKDDLLAAIRFYERRGYRACERYNDNPQATIFMRRQLR